MAGAGHLQLLQKVAYILGSTPVAGIHGTFSLILVPALLPFQQSL